MQKIKSGLANPALAWVVVLVVFGSFLTYNWLNSPNSPIPPDPDLPVPVLVGLEEKIPVGDNAYLSLTPYKIKPANLEDLSIDWQVWYDGKRVALHKTLEGKVFFAVGVEPNRKYDVFVTVSYLYKINNKHSIKTFLLKDFVTVDGPVVPPEPVIPVFPEGKYGLSKFIWDAAKDVKSNQKKMIASALSQRFSAISMDVKNNRYKTTEAVLKASLIDNKSVMITYGEPVSNWENLFVRLQEKLFKLDDDGSFSDNVSNIGIAFEEIALGLSKVQ